MNITPTWNEIGNIVCRLIDSHEWKALTAMQSEIKRAFALAQLGTEFMQRLKADGESDSVDAALARAEFDAYMEVLKRGLLTPGVET